ncbi:hypothetical protein [Bradyrhizobium sp. McL0615]|uniref:hypothetical protein n=1 Tax=Bradyrhizobium sp. McL0615 TaxID=3415673 RepID=UPI003CE98151
MLVINCAHDQIVTQTPELAASIPGSMYQQISAGHLAYFEGADEFLGHRVSAPTQRVGIEEVVVLYSFTWQPKGDRYVDP